LANKAAVPVTLAFKTTTALTTGGKITLNYPAGLFAATPNPGNNMAGSTSVATMTATSAIAGNSVVITTAVAGIAANAAFTMTLSGLTMGAAALADSPAGITVQTDADVTASAGVASGVLNSQATAVTFAIAAGDRLANKAAVPVTLAFKTTTALTTGGKITLNYPAGLFAATPNPGNNMAGSTSVATMTATSAIAGNSVVITTAVAGIAANAAFTMTLSGLTMGAAALADSPAGITVQTDADVTASAGVASGVLNSQATAVTFAIAAGDRLANKAAVPVTLAFKTTTALTTGGKITLNYPAGLFAATPNPGNNMAGSTSVATMTATSAIAGNSVVITTAVAGIAANAAFTMTLSGLTMGAAALADSPAGITVQTDADVTASAGVASGVLNSQATAVTFAIAAGDRLANKAAVPVTLAFKTTTALTTGGKITLNYPAGLFAATPNPGNNMAGSTSVATMTATSAIAGNSVVITTAVAGIAANAAFTMTLSGLTMGAAALADSPAGITVQTDADVTASAGVASGVLNSQATAVTFAIAAGDRLANKAAVPVTLAFKTTTALTTGGKITLNYPAGLFAATPNPGNNMAGSTSVATMTATSAIAGNSVVITTAVAGIAANAAFTMTLSGLTMGAAALADSPAGITVQTDADVTASAGVASGVLNSQATAVTFAIAAGDRLANKAAVPVTLAFKTTTALTTGGKITLNYPAGLFAATPNPGNNMAGSTSVATMTATSAIAGNSVVITTAVAGIAANAAFTMTLSGLTMGAAALADSPAGITVQTDADVTASAGVASGVLNSQATAVTFAIAAGDRLANKAAVPVTLAFKTTTALTTGGKITLNYPAGLFAATPNPGNNMAGSTSVATMTATSAIAGNSVVITTAVAGIAANAAFTMTLSGLTMGAAALADSPAGITVQTDADVTASAGVASGVLNSQATAVTFAIAAGDRLANKAAVPVTLAFKTTTALTTGGKITLNYPAGLFAATPNPGNNMAGSTSVATMTATSAIAGNSVVITTAVAGIAANAAFTMTLSGLTMGAAALADSPAGITVQTDADVTASAGVASGVLNSQATAVTFAIAAGDRLANKAAVPVTLAFKTTTALTTGGKITLNYPAGLFAATPNPGNNMAGSTSVATMTATSAIAGNSVVITTAVAGIAANAAFTMTLSGLTMGAAALADSPAGITVQTDADVTASAGVASGVLNSQATAVTFAIAAGDRLANKAAVPVTLAFKTTTALTTGGKITLNYPAGLFAATPNPGNNMAGSTSVATMTATSAIAGNSVVITTAVAGIAANAAFTMTLSGLTMGAAALADSPAGITVQTDADVTASAGVASGVLNSQATAVTFAIAAGDRLANKAAVPVTLAFKTTTALTTGGKITLNYPAGLFAATPNPGNNMAGSTSVATMTATSAIAGNSVVITTAVAGIAANAAFTMTLSGLTMGAAALADSPAGITVQTDADVTASAGVASGLYLNSQATAVTFAIAATAVPLGRHHHARRARWLLLGIGHLHRKRGYIFDGDLDPRGDGCKHLTRAHHCRRRDRHRRHHCDADRTHPGRRSCRRCWRLPHEVECRCWIVCCRGRCRHHRNHFHFHHLRRHCRRCRDSRTRVHSSH
jgi:hypothetical protein